MSRSKNAVVLLAAVLVTGPCALQSYGSSSIPPLGDPALAAEAMSLEQQMPDHLFNGSVLGVHYRTPEHLSGDIDYTTGGGDSGLWSGVYLAAESFRYAVAKHHLAVADKKKERAAAEAEMSAAMTRVKDLAWAEHRRISISGDWKPVAECGASTLGTGRNPTAITPGTKPNDVAVRATGNPNATCGVTDPGVGLYGPGQAFRQCQPAGVNPVVQQQDAHRPRMIYGPITWHVDGKQYYCEGGTSRDAYDGTVFGLLTAFDFASPDDAGLRAQVRDDVESMTGYFATHGWSSVYPDTSASTEGNENVVFPIFAYTPSARLAMASAARHVADLAGPDAQTTAFFDTLYREELGSQVPGLPVDYALTLKSPSNGYYINNLNHLINFDILRTEPDPTTRTLLASQFAMIDATTRHAVNAHFEAITYALTGEPGRARLSVTHLRDWIAYRSTPAYVAHNSPRCSATDTSHIDCMNDHDVDYHQATPVQDINVTVGDPTDPQLPATGATTQRAVQALPVALRPRGEDFLWQRNPFRLDGGPQTPDEVQPGVDFLMPYWMLRYYTEVAPPTLSPLPPYLGPSANGTG